VIPHAHPHLLMLAKGDALGRDRAVAGHAVEHPGGRTLPRGAGVVSVIGRHRRSTRPDNADAGARSPRQDLLLLGTSAVLAAPPCRFANR